MPATSARTLKPALGDLPLREIRGPVLDTFYSRLRTCGALCDGRPLVEHRYTQRGQDARGAHDCARAGCRPHACRPMAAGTVRQIAGILSGAFAAAQRWEWTGHNPAGSAKLPKVARTRPQVPSPADVAKLIAAAARDDRPLAVFLWLAAITGARRAELCGLRWHRIDPAAGTVHVARTYVVSGGQRIEKDTKTHQDRRLAIDPATRDMLRGFKEQTAAALAAAGVALAGDAFVFSNDGGTTPWNPDWVTHQVARAAEAAGVAVNIKSLRHYTATHLLAAGVDITNTAALLAGTLTPQAGPARSGGPRSSI